MQRDQNRFEIPAETRDNVAAMHAVDRERERVSSAVGFLERGVAKLGHSDADKQLMTKAGAAMANGHRYAVQLTLLTAYPNNTPAARAEATQSQGAWHDALKELRTADTRGHFKDTLGLHRGLLTQGRARTSTRDRDERREPAERKPGPARPDR
ncbi:MAG: hypothetical protein GEV07_11075 [Streptosporangiales bacterium]|nr:hypothetical protein [Streptosporangiales bacterium]